MQFTDINIIVIHNISTYWLFQEIYEEKISKFFKNTNNDKISNVYTY